MKSVLRRRWVPAATAVILLGLAAAQPAYADNPRPSLTQAIPGLTQAIPGLPDGLAGSGALAGVPKLANGLPKLSPELLADPAGSTGTDKRDFGTPTKAADKVCPFTGNVPVSIPLVNSPVGSSLPGLGGYTLSQPSIPGSIYGELCMSNESLAAAREGRPPAVLVLVHGITYGTWYWDSPYQPAKYSVVNGLIRHGYATLNIDRIGEGRSSHPISAAVTADTNAETVHQLVQKLHAGDIGGTRFEHIGLVGHSYGTITTWLETAKYNDTDTVIGTGYGNRFKLDQGALLFGGLIPASLQPLYKGQPWALDPGYMSFRPGIRANSPFFYKPDMDPAIFPIDEALQSPVTVEELATFVNREYDGTHKNIRTPTFIINGEHDSFFCGPQDIACTTSATHSDGPATLERLAKANTDYEAPGFSSQACLRTAVIPDSGHNINFHLNANQVWEQIAYFADDAMGDRGQNTASYRQQCDSKPGSLTDILPEIGRLIPPTNLPIS